jgi:hypothetical protein
MSTAIQARPPEPRAHPDEGREQGGGEIFGQTEDIPRSAGRRSVRDKHRDQGETPRDINSQIARAAG